MGAIMIRKRFGRCLICAVTAAACHLSAPTILRAEIRLCPEHAANRLDGIEGVQFAKGVLTLKAQRPTTGTLVLTCSPFLDVVSVSNAKATTRRDWDK
jgi:hypothetical protein